MPIVIDGNNLLFAMHDEAPIPNVGRETMLRIIERFAMAGNESICVVFDGRPPLGGMGGQFHSSRVDVRFGAPKTADDVIVDMIQRSNDPARLHVVTADGAIAHEARARRCPVIAPVDFIRAIFPQPERGANASPPASEKPTLPDRSEVDELLRLMDQEDVDLRDDRDLFDAK